MEYEYNHSISFRVYYDSNADSWLDDWIDGWLDGWEGWEHPDYSPNELPALTESENGTDEYYTALWWFSWEHDPNSMYDALIKDNGSEGTLPDACEWARVLYHECGHPGDDVECSWNEQRDHGSVPEYITQM